MSLILGLFLALGIGVILLEIGAKIPAKYRDLDTPRLRSLIELLYVRGFDGGTLKIVRRDNRRTLVQVRKVIDAPDRVRLEVRVPAAGASTAELGRLELIAPGVDDKRQSDAALLEPDADLFVLDAGPHVARALVLVEDLLSRYYQVKPNKDCIAWIERAHGNVRAHPGFTSAPDRVV